MSSEERHEAEAIDLLRKLIAIPSFSKQEDKTADLIGTFLQTKGVKFQRSGNNVWARNQFYSSNRPTILLNSHHDTVKPATGYTLDPFAPIVKDGKLYGLGSNDAGGALVTLLAVFLILQEKKDLPWNLVYAATAEEEISGKNGIESILQSLDPIDLAIVGEPTEMKMAIAERGLLVLDYVCEGAAGHAARSEGQNAIYLAMQDIEWFKTFRFDRESQYLGPVKMTVTQISAGKNHNAIPDRCEMVIDVRCTDSYPLKDTVAIIKGNIRGEIQPRSLRLHPSSLSSNHPMLKVAEKLGIATYGSPTLSDQALMPFPSIKMGPGDSSRSHTSNEFIYLREIGTGIDSYLTLLRGLKANHIRPTTYETLG